MQWAGKNALPAIHCEFPALTIYQTEQECGDGTNRWSYTSYCWQLMKHYFRSGASADEGGEDFLRKIPKKEAAINPE